MRFFVLSLLYYLLLLTSTVNGASLTHTDINQLASLKEWQDLLHYHKAGLYSPDASQIDDDAFFLDKNGRVDAAAELRATIKAFQSVKATDDPNLAAQCVYPARYHWLKKQAPELGLVDMACPDFDKWFHKIDGEGVYLVFPAAYLNSPSSMYGHTLFRVKKKGNDTPLLDYAVNYAANADPDDNQLVFSYKGLSGGYPGVISVMPYYQKVKEYNFLESRDIWEYKLDLTPFEVSQFVRHVWEIQNSYMSYYFFSENCSYQLLTMLDASSPRLNLSDEFPLWAIPADTVRTMKAAHILDEASYRPSVLNRMTNMLAQLKDEDIAVARRLVDKAKLKSEELSSYDPTEQARILEVAYAYSRYLSARQKSSLSYLNSRSIKLLSMRSRLPMGQVFAPVPVPAIRDDQGHKTQRIALSVGKSAGQAYSVLEYRPSYHDLLDLQGGYLKGAELSMFSGSVRLKDSEGLELDTLAFINIRSLAPKNALVLPKSWQINASLLHDETITDDLVFRLKGGAGVTFETGQSLYSLLFNGSGSVADEYQNGYRLEVGPELKWLWYGEKNTLQIEYEYLSDVNIGARARQMLGSTLAHQLNQDWQWRFHASRVWYNSSQWDNLSIQLLHYF